MTLQNVCRWLDLVASAYPTPGDTITRTRQGLRLLSECREDGLLDDAEVDRQLAAYEPTMTATWQELEEHGNLSEDLVALCSDEGTARLQSLSVTGVDGHVYRWSPDKGVFAWDTDQDEESSDPDTCGNARTVWLHVMVLAALGRQADWLRWRETVILPLAGNTKIRDMARTQLHHDATRLILSLSLLPRSVWTQLDLTDSQTTVDAGGEPVTSILGDGVDTVRERIGAILGWDIATDVFPGLFPNLGSVFSEIDQSLGGIPGAYLRDDRSYELKGAAQVACAEVWIDEFLGRDGVYVDESILYDCLRVIGLCEIRHRSWLNPVEAADQWNILFPLMTEARVVEFQVM